jgi:hypothetical protein
MRPWRCRQRCADTVTRYGARMAWSWTSGWGLTPARWWCGVSTTTYTWTTRPSGRRCTWRRAWNRWRCRARSSSLPRCGAWLKAMSRAHRWGRWRSRDYMHQSRCMSWWGLVQYDRAYRRLPPRGSPTSSGGIVNWMTSTRPCNRPGGAVAKWSPWWGTRAWGSPAWCMRWCTRTAPRAGGSWRVPRYPTVRRRPTSPSSTY